MSNETKLWIKDTAERVIWTWIESFVGLLVLDTGVAGVSLDLGVVKIAFASATIAALAVLKAAVASRRDSLSPASMARGI